jgi:hypothetical protein
MSNALSFRIFASTFYLISEYVFPTSAITKLRKISAAIKTDIKKTAQNKIFSYELNPLNISKSEKSPSENLNIVR